MSMKIKAAIESLARSHIEAEFGAVRMALLLPPNASPEMIRAALMLANEDGKRLVVEAAGVADDAKSIVAKARLEPWDGCGDGIHYLVRPCQPRHWPTEHLALNPLWKSLLD